MALKAEEARELKDKARMMCFSNEVIDRFCATALRSLSCPHLGQVMDLSPGMWLSRMAFMAKRRARRLAKTPFIPLMHPPRFH